MHDTARQAVQKQVNEEKEKIRKSANALFETEAGKIYAYAMLKASGYFEVNGKGISESERVYSMAVRDFVSLFLVNLIDNSILIDILRRKESE